MIIPSILRIKGSYGIYIIRLPDSIPPPKHLIPKEYNVTNLWRVELSQFWRMLYTIKGDQIEIICFVLDILSHPDYDKKFGYKKK